MRKKELVFVSTVFCFFITLIVGIFRNGVLLFGDTDLTYHFGSKFFDFDNLYLWNDYFQSGIFDFNKFQGFFLKKIIYLVNITVGNLYIFSYLWYYLAFFFYALTFYFLIKEFVKNYATQKLKIVLISIILGLFAMFNGIFVLYAGQTLFIIALIMINIFLLFFLRNINFIKEYQKNNYGYMIIMALAISEAAIYVQIIFLLLYAGVIFTLLSYKFILKYFRAFLTLFLFISLIVSLLSSTWAVVLFNQFVNHNASIGKITNYDVNIGWKAAESISGNIYLNELLRLKSYHVFNQIPVLFYFFGFVPIIIILIYFLKNKKNKNYFFLSLLLLLLISLFLSYGIHPNTKGIYTILWKYIPFFNTFRTVMKFSFIFLYSLIFLLAVILAKTRNIKVFTVYSFLIFLTIPFSISYFRQPEFARNMKQYKIPDYYFEIRARNFDNTDNIIGNNMLLPQINWQSQYEWAPKKIDSMNILPYFYGKGNFINGAQYAPDPQYLYNDYFSLFFKGGFTKELSKLLQLRNVKYITYQNDLRFSGDETEQPALSNSPPTLQGKPSLENATQTLNKDICSSTESIGELMLCRVNNSIFIPIFFVGNDKVVVRKQTHIDLFQEAPTILTDLAMLELFGNDALKFFETDKKSIEVNPSAETYQSMRAYTTQNCYNNGLPCNIYFAEDIPEGEYDIYFRHYPITSYLIITDIERFMNKDYKVEIYDNVDSNYINDSVNNFGLGLEVQPPKQFESMKIVDYFNGDDSNYLGKIYLKGKNITIRTNNNNYWSYGRFYFVKKNDQKLVTDKGNKPIIEFKKINPTKYRIKVHQAKDSFPLVFSENFHEDWKVYLASSNSPKNPNDKLQINSETQITNYKILEGNKDDQSSKEEVQGFISKGWLTDLGDGQEKIIKHNKWEDGKEKLDHIEKYKIDFISKNFQGTIQNDNLPSGKFYETWLAPQAISQKLTPSNSVQNRIDLGSIKSKVKNLFELNKGVVELPKENHLMVNGYANSWIINPDEVCKAQSQKSKSLCIRNPDGTYDMELVVEFWPQRLFYIGLFISGLTFTTCLIYLVFFIRRKKS